MNALTPQIRTARITGGRCIRSAKVFLPGSVIIILIGTRVRRCPDCRRDNQTRTKPLEQAIPAGVSINLSIRQQANFAFDHPEQTPVRWQNESAFAVLSSAPENRERVCGRAGQEKTYEYPTARDRCLFTRYLIKHAALIRKLPVSLG